MINFKRGDTFELPLCTFWKNKTLSEKQSLTGVTIKSKIRKGSTLVDTLLATIISAVDGTFSLKQSITSKDWPVGTLDIDIEFTLVGGSIISTSTFQINCIKDITHDE